jgi:hypothetical protein
MTCPIRPPIAPPLLRMSVTARVRSKARASVVSVIANVRRKGPCGLSFASFEGIPDVVDVEQTVVGRDKYGILQRGHQIANIARAAQS